MKVFRGIESIKDYGDCTITVGSFDGVHSGHASLLNTLQQRAKANNSKSVVVSFSPHPRVTLGRSEGMKLLTSDTEKADLLGNIGIDALLLIEFDKAFSSLSYEDFLVEYLQKRAGMVELIAGFNHKLGHDSGNFEALRNTAQSHNFAITQAVEYSHYGDKISSTIIRKLIDNGDVEEANKLLSHPYLVIGQSDKDGKVAVDEPLKLIPPAGQYIADIEGEKHVITIDTNRIIWCDKRDQNVRIKIEKRYEK